MVTGSAKRIGKSIALKLAEQGASMFIHARRHSDDADAVLGQIRQMGRNAELTLHDLEDSDDTAQWFEDLVQRQGIDILVNSACGYDRETYDEITLSSLTSAMAVQVFSPLVMMRAMRRSGRPGTVVNILDTRFDDRDSIHVSYHLAKRSLYTITRDLAMEYAPTITVNAVAPGIILPPKNHGTAWLERIAAATPLAAHGKPEDVAEAVSYLVQAPFVTGQVIFVDGGRNLKGNAYGLWNPG